MTTGSWTRTEADKFNIDDAGSNRIIVRLLYQNDDGPAELDFPIVVIGRGHGPTALVTGGTHGDEFEGQAVAWYLARSLTPEDVLGRVIIVPTHNRPACIAGTRTSPVDGLDLNRIYPGRDLPGLSHAIARFVSGTLMPAADIYLDLHTGGHSTEFVLSSNLQGRPGTDAFDRDLPGLLAMDAPYALVFDEDESDSMPHRGTTEAYFQSLGRPAFSSEYGGGRMTAHSFQTALGGALNLLRHCGVVSGPTIDPSDSRSQLLFMRGRDHYVPAPCHGLLVPDVLLGDHVGKGDTLATLFPHDPVVGPQAMRARTDGVVVAIATVCPGEGEPALMIAEPIAR